MAYTVQETPELQDKLQQADGLRAEIDKLRPLRPNLWETLLKKQKIDWTYDSNAIEGSTLSRGDTHTLLEYGITVKGKPLKDFLDARNHAEAIDFLYDIIRNNRPITAGMIKEINGLLMAGVLHTPAMNEYGQAVQKPATPGEYKNLPNHVLQPDGSIHCYVEPIHVATEMDQLTNWVSNNVNRLHPAITGAVAHYNMVRIHPFDDGNGRGARILMNLILMKEGFVPAIIRNDDRSEYIEALVQADKGELTQFVTFVTESLNQTQEDIISDLKSV